MNKFTAEVIIDGRVAKLICECGKGGCTVYVQDYLTLLQIDTPIDKDCDACGFCSNILSDISNRRIEIFKYTFFNYCRYDFLVKNSIEWDDYPRPEDVSLVLMRLFGKRKTCGYLEISTDKKANKVL